MSYQYDPYHSYGTPPPPPNQQPQQWQPQLQQQQPQQNAQKDEKKDKNHWIITGIVVPIVVALIGAGFLVHNNTGGGNNNPAPSFPQLNHNYTGTAANLVTNVSFPVSMFNVAENTSNGTFTASMTTGTGCNGQVSDGTVSTSDDISFTFNAEQSLFAACGGVLTVNFKGNINSSGEITGNWDAPNAGTNGSFNLS